MAYLEIKGFYKQFGEVEVLKGIDLEINKGEVVSIIGSSGSGKTTLLRCINFLETPDFGEMILDGEILFDETLNNEKESTLREKRLNFGLVFQSFNLFPQYNVLKNITLAPTLLLKDKIKKYKKELQCIDLINNIESLKVQKKKELKKLKKDLYTQNITEEEIEKNIEEFLETENNKISDLENLLAEKFLSPKEIKQKLNDFKSSELEKIEQESLELLDKIGLTDKINAYPCELSGGQCQRVAIARALALKPKILCFDEPTSALDPELTGEVLKVIKSLKDENRTMIIVTHEMGFARNVSDKVVFMYNGVIEEYGEASILDNPKSEYLKSFLSNVNEKEYL